MMAAMDIRDMRMPAPRPRLLDGAARINKPRRRDATPAPITIQAYIGLRRSSISGIAPGCLAAMLARAGALIVVFIKGSAAPHILSVQMPEPSSAWTIQTSNQGKRVLK